MTRNVNSRKEMKVKAKKIWRYYCDYCKKAGCNKYWIVKHEKGCTKNPNRECGFCKILELEQRDMKELLAILPDPKEFTKMEYWEDGEGEVISGSKLNEILDLQKLRDITNNCPACILAALRQKKICVPMVEGFDFKGECASVWADINEANRGYEY